MYTIFAVKFMKPRIDKNIREFLAEIGREGGKARARNHSKEELSKWAKEGGRPEKDFHELSTSGRYARKRRDRERKSAAGGK